MTERAMERRWDAQAQETAIREAVEAERERCAEIALSFGRPHAFAFLRRKIGLGYPAKPQSLAIQAMRTARAIRKGEA